jgi:hypothetical protein
MIIGIALVVVSCAGGVWFGITFTEERMTALRITHKKEMDEIFEEVKRLRAQSANLIGRE